MKKFIYVLILVITSIATFSSCTEDNITPRGGETPASGSASVTKGA